MTKKNIQAAVKEILRLVVFAIPGIVLQVVSGDVALSTAYGGAILAVLRGIDKAIHEDATNKANGLLPF